MANQRGMRRIRLAFIQQGLQLPGRPVKEERFDSGSHIILLPENACLSEIPSVAREPYGDE